MGLLTYDRTPVTFDRTFALESLQIMRSGDGRTVEAYAAIFDKPYEVHDVHGHYYEKIERYAFDEELKRGALNTQCLYNHGMTIHGTPDMLGSVPLGTPLEIRADSKGLLTVTRYNETQLADAVLAAIRNGDIKSQSFRGRIVRSSPNGPVPKRRTGAQLPTVIRHELGLTDYGPTPIPVNAAAEIVAVRSLVDLAHDLQQLDVDERLELLRTLGADLDGDGIEGDLEDLEEVVEQGASAGSEDDTADVSTGDGADGSRSQHSGRLALKREMLIRALQIRGVGRGEAA